MPSLMLPYPPSTNRIWRSYRGVTVKSAKAESFQREVRFMALQAGVRPLSSDVAVVIHLHPKQPKRVTGKRVRCIDLDNAAKAALDALNGIAWADDSQIVQIQASRKEPIPGGGLYVEWR